MTIGYDLGTLPADLVKSNRLLGEKSTFGRFLNAILSIVFVDPIKTLEKC